MTVRAKRRCSVHMLDDFKSVAYHFNLATNALLTVRSVAPHSDLSLPGQKGSAHVLEARVTADSVAPSTFGRRFPLAQDWTGNKALMFWFHGTKSGKRMKVYVFGKQAPDPGPSGWQLAWSDEFNGLAGAPPNPAVWAHDTGNGNGGWGNNELEYYTDSMSNAAMDGSGNLIITARKVAPQTQLSCYYGSCQYTSPRLLTKDRMQFAHGHIEARIRIPRGEGLWPAFWALGTNIEKVGWPQTGEIDIMENVGRLPRRLFGTIHGPGYSGANGFGGAYDAPGDLANEFHAYAVEWQPSRITWAIDGREYKSAMPQDVGPNQWVYNHPFFLLLNVGVGGSFVGPVGASTVFPQSMAVDYARVYAPPDTATRFESTFSDSHFGWRRVTLPFVAFKRSVDQPNGAPGGGLSLKTIWGYAFEAPADTTAPILVTHIGLERAPHGQTCVPQ